MTCSECGWDAEPEPEPDFDAQHEEEMLDLADLKTERAKLKEAA